MAIRKPRIPRAFKSHRSVEGALYGQYIRAKVARLGSLPVEARPVLNPKPLSYQSSFERAGTFTWTYLEEGPDVWRVEIGKT